MNIINIPLGSRVEMNNQDYLNIHASLESQLNYILNGI